MASLTKMLAILDLFTPDTPAWNVEGIAAKLQYSVPTTYRYVKELCSAGLLLSKPGAKFMLGARIIELDYQIRTADPLLKAAQPIMNALAHEVNCDVVLGMLYNNDVLTIHHEFVGEGVQPGYGRGRKLPPFKGALSKAVLSSISRKELDKFYDANQQSDDGSVIIQWDELLEDVKKTRARQYAISKGELEKAFVGIAVPMKNANLDIAAALGLIMTPRYFSLIETRRVVEILRDCATRILRDLDEGTSRLSSLPA